MAIPDQQEIGGLTMAHQRRFTSPEAHAKIDAILDHMEGSDFVTVPEVMQAAGVGENSAGDYLRHMSRQGLVHCSRRAVTYQSGSLPARWKIGAAPDEDMECDFQRKVVVLKTWAGALPVMFEPMAFLFGRAA